MYGDNIGQENEEAYRSLSAKYDDLGKKTQILCYIIIATIVQVVLVFVFAIVAVAIDYTTGSETASTLFSIIVGLIGFGISMFYGITVMGMGIYDEELKTAGILYIVSAICTNLNNMFFDDTWIGFILELAAAVLSVIYMIKFATCMEYLTFNADSSVSDSWGKFKNAFIIVTVGTVVSVLFMFIPIIRILAVLASIVFIIALIVVYIWQIVLLFKTSAAMRNFSKGDRKVAKFFE